MVYSHLIGQCTSLYAQLIGQQHITGKNNYIISPFVSTKFRTEINEILRYFRYLKITVVEYSEKGSKISKINLNILRRTASTHVWCINY